MLVSRASLRATAFFGLNSRLPHNSLASLARTSEANLLIIGFSDPYTSSFGCPIFRARRGVCERAYYEVVCKRAATKSQPKSGQPWKGERILGNFVVKAHLQCLFNIARSPCLKLASNFFLQMREYRGQRTLKSERWEVRGENRERC